jgi:putative DNA methylase
MAKPKLLIEQWLPIDAIGAECMRDVSAAKRPPLSRLHVWWARRPLTVSRAAILASLLPAYPVGDRENLPAWPKELQNRFPSFSVYQQWFLALIGIQGNVSEARRLLNWARLRGKSVPNPYVGPRAFSVNAQAEQLETLYDLLEWTWGWREIEFCDPMSGGGSIPFEALRYGLSVQANELNPVASVILKGTLEFPSRYGESLTRDLRKYGQKWVETIQKRLRPFFTDLPDDSIGACYLWARTVACPTTGKLVPLSPNWWLRKGANPTVVRLIADKNEDRCQFEVVQGRSACERANPDQGTIKRGTGLSPWTGETIDGDYIKSEAQAGRMGQQLYAVGIKKEGSFPFRPPIPSDERKYELAGAEFEKRRGAWDTLGLVPTEPRREGRADWACGIYGASQWKDTFSPRQLLSMITLVECLHEVVALAASEIGRERAEALRVYLAIAIDKAADYNSKQVAYDSTRDKIVHAFTRHDLSMRWSFAEFDASRNLASWVLSQVCDAYVELAKFLGATDISLFRDKLSPPAQRLRLKSGPAQSLKQ